MPLIYGNKKEVLIPGYIVFLRHIYIIRTYFYTSPNERLYFEMYHRCEDVCGIRVFDDAINC